MTPHEQTTERRDPTERADPLIDEVREVRKAISDRVNDDFDELGGPPPRLTCDVCGGF